MAGVDVDAVCLCPAQDLAALRAAITESVSAESWQPLPGIEALLLDPLQEWLLPGERCVAIAQPSSASLRLAKRAADLRHGQWQIVYDTQFGVARLADALALAFPDAMLVQAHLQEETDAALRVLRNGGAVYEYSNAPAAFNWGRCLGKAEAARLQLPDAAGLAAAWRPLDAERAGEFLKTLASRRLGERSGPKSPRHHHEGGCHDALHGLLAEMGLPRLYRFFQGWMRSDLDWDEDAVLEVLMFRAHLPF